MSVETSIENVAVSISINGAEVKAEVEPRMLLVDYIREVADLTGTHVGCDSTNCGACTVIVDGVAVKSCTMFAAQASGLEVRTVEGLSDGDQLSDLQQSFHEHHSLQCGYCTPGMLMASTAMLESNPQPTRDEIKNTMSGNLCRCTVYRFIIDAIEATAAARAAKEDGK
jgi:aerobic carbon-monoxide dehydrogenase small subunit